MTAIRVAGPRPMAEPSREQRRRAEAQREYRSIHQALKETGDQDAYDAALRTWAARYPEYAPDGCCSGNISPVRRNA